MGVGGVKALAMYNSETAATIAVLVNSTSGLSPFYSLWNQVFDLGLGTPELVPGDIPTTLTDDTTATTAPSGDSTDDGAAGDGPAGEAVIVIRDSTVEAEIVECTLVEPDVTFRAQGETVQFEVYTLDDGSGEAGVTVSGGIEFEGRGPDPSTPVEDFTLAATIESC